MRSIQKMHTKKPLLWIIIGLIVVAGLATSVYLLALNNQKASQDSTKNGSSVQEEQNDDTKKEDAIDSDISNPGTTPVPEENNIQIETKRESDGTLTVLTKLYGVSDGTCKLTVTRNSVTTTYNADVIYQSEYSTCAGYSIRVSDVGSGEWKLSLTVTSNGVSATKSATVNVQ